MFEPGLIDAGYVREIVLAEDEFLDSAEGRDNFEESLPGQVGLDQDQALQTLEQTAFLGQEERLASTSDLDLFEVFEGLLRGFQVVVGNGEFLEFWEFVA